MRTEEEIRKKLEEIRESKRTGTHMEQKNIAWHGTKQALEWVLEEADTPLTY